MKNPEFISIGSEISTLLDASGAPSLFLARREEWGQPPARCYVFKVINGVLQGQLVCEPKEGYLVSSSQATDSGSELTLGQEFEAWDLLSDDAWISFERSLE